MEEEGIGRIDWLEEGLRSVFLQGGAQMIEALLNDPAFPLKNDQADEEEKTLHQRSRNVQSLFGPLRITRRGYYHPETGKSRYPLDESLELIDSFTPQLAGLIGRAAAFEPYELAAGNLNAYTGLELESRSFQRLIQRVGPAFSAALEEDVKPIGEAVERMYVSADGTGIPLRRDALKGRKGKGVDGKAKTHEIKMGCVFSASNKPGEKALRDPDSSTYIATPKRCEAFGLDLLKEARRRNIGKAKEVVFMSDGAAWIKEIVRTSFPQATWIRPPDLGEL